MTNWSEVITQAGRNDTSNDGEIQERIRRHGKMQIIRQCVAEPIVRMMLDPNSEFYDSKNPNVLVSGSSATWDIRNRTRVGSDFDLLLICGGLQDPSKYVRFLHEVRELSVRLVVDYGLVPFYFTSSDAEAGILDIGSRYWDEEGRVSISVSDDMNQQTGSDCSLISTLAEPFGNVEYDGTSDRYVSNDMYAEYGPVHFLFYPSPKLYFAREPDRLASRLLHASVPLIGSNGFTPSDQADNQHSIYLDRARWAYERCIADYVLNMDLLPPSFLFSRFAAQILGITRGPFLQDVLYADIETASYDNIIALLNKDFSDMLRVDIGELFIPLLHIHKRGWTGDTLKRLKTTRDDLIKPAIALLNIIDLVGPSSNNAPLGSASRNNSIW